MKETFRYGIPVVLIIVIVIYPVRFMAFALRWSIITLKESNSLTLNKPECEQATRSI
jgi:hypothetical protein